MGFYLNWIWERRGSDGGAKAFGRKLNTETQRSQRTAIQKTKKGRNERKVVGNRIR
jgi:hypothetical protein